MIGNASSHCRCGLATGLGQTRVRCAEVIDRPDHIHAMLQGQRAARERPASTRQRRQTLTERRIQPLDIRRVDAPSPCERRLSVSTRAGVPSTMRRLVSTTRRRS